jgi:hypothetical protein
LAGGKTWALGAVPDPAAKVTGKSDGRAVIVRKSGGKVSKCALTIRSGVLGGVDRVLPRA